MDDLITKQERWEQRCRITAANIANRAALRSIEARGGSYRNDLEYHTYLYDYFFGKFYDIALTKLYPKGDGNDQE